MGRSARRVRASPGERRRGVRRASIRGRRRVVHAAVADAVAEWPVAGRVPGRAGRAAVLPASLPAGTARGAYPMNDDAPRADVGAPATAGLRARQGTPAVPATERPDTVVRALRRAGWCRERRRYGSSTTSRRSPSATDPARRLWRAPDSTRREKRSVRQSPQRACRAATRPAGTGASSTGEPSVSDAPNADVRDPSQSGQGDRRADASGHRRC